MKTLAKCLREEYRFDSIKRFFYNLSRDCKAQIFLIKKYGFKLSSWIF